MKIYLVEDNGNAPGRIYACFADEEDAHQADEEDAHQLANALNEDCRTGVVERTLWYGQPPNRGYNE